MSNRMMGILFPVNDDETDPFEEPKLTAEDLDAAAYNRDLNTLLHQNRRLIAAVQALIAAHRYPDMYNVEGVVEDAETTWRRANEVQLRISESLDNT